MASPCCCCSVYVYVASLVRAGAVIVAGQERQRHRGGASAAPALLASSESLEYCGCSADIASASSLSVPQVFAGLAPSPAAAAGLTPPPPLQHVSSTHREAALGVPSSTGPTAHREAAAGGSPCPSPSQWHRGPSGAARMRKRASDRSQQMCTSGMPRARHAWVAVSMHL